MPFQQLGLAVPIQQAVKESGYTEPTPIQVAAIPVILQRHDLMGIAQTGTGKTAAFVLPLLSLMAANPPQHRGIRGLIMVPTRELVVQVEENIHNYARHLPLRIATILEVSVNALKFGLCNRALIWLWPPQEDFSI